MQRLVRIVSVLALGLVIVVASACSSSVEVAVDPVLRVSVLGTRLKSDQAGLPVAIDGVVFQELDGGRSAPFGTYHETVTALVDEKLGFSGSSGRAVLRLPAGQDARRWATIVVETRSRIIGEAPATGETLVASSGRVLESNHPLAAVGSILTSRSRVLLAPEAFGMRTRAVLSGSVGSASAELSPEASAGELILDIGSDGASMRFEPAFRAALTARMLVEELSSDDLARATGLDRELLERWRTAALEFHKRRVMLAERAALGALPPAPPPRLAAELGPTRLEGTLTARGSSVEAFTSWLESVRASLGGVEDAEAEREALEAIAANLGISKADAAD